jgi:pimeloyl-ACP methyl ester carboxylesterase
MADPAGAAPADDALLGEHQQLGGRTVSVTVEPGIGPPVILLAGCGMPSYAWDPVARLLVGRTRVRLDRPGMGGTPWPNHLPTLAEETGTLVELAQQHPGGVFVAHSMASFHAEAAIRRRPDLVVGLVLVDGSVEPVPHRPVGEAAWLAVARAAELAAKAPPLAALGPLADRITITAQSRRRLLDPVDPRSVATYSRADAVASVIAESAAYRRQALDLTRVRVSSGWPAGLPVEVLSARASGGQRSVAAQQQLTDLLGGRQTVLADSGHLMMMDQPQAIADAVWRVLRTIEQSA